MTTAILLILVVGRGDEGEPFTEFYLLGPAGTADGYPATLTPGEEASLVLGIVNREGRETVYSVSLFVDGTLVDEIEGLRLGPRQRWEQPVGFTLTQAGERQLVEFVLYRDGRDRPYRTLHLWVDGRERKGSVLAGAEAPTSAGAEAPPLETTPTGPEAQPPGPQYTVHIVERGENLTAISWRYGVPLGAVLQANAGEIANPNLIYPNQRILIPVEAQ